MPWIDRLAIANALFQVAGGLALFLYGLNRLSKGLEQMAGDALRNGLQRATRHPAGGLSLGTALGFFLHSSGATVMLVGFLNAGLVPLANALPVMLGANIGTTLNMQAVSLSLDSIRYPALALGFAMMLSKRPPLRSTGTAIFGFGLLFLGMDTMSSGVEPYKASLAPLLQQLDGSHWQGMLAGIGLSMGITSILQSSGATIGMAFALVQAGIYTDLAQVMPIVLGAHIGTCVTALLACMGGRPPARRIALAHLLFNVFNVSLAVLFHRPLLQALASIGGSLVRQTANLHTGVMLTSALLVLPFCPGFAGLLKRLIRSRPHPETEQSHLTTDAMAHPDTALLAVRRELERLTRLGLRSLELTSALLRRPSLEDHREVKTIETIFDAVKSTMLRELRRLLRHPDLSRAEILEVDRWMHRAVQMERIGDHLDTLRKISEERRQEPGHLLFGRDLTARLDDMFARTRDELDALARWLHEGSHSPYTEITERHLAFLAAANEARERLTSKMQDARLQPRAMYYYSSYLEVFERLFRHIQLVALPGSITLLDEESEQEKTDAGTQNPFSA